MVISESENKIMEKMLIEVWSDFVCPFCYVGKRKLENAIAASGYKDQIEVVYKAYQLDQNAPLTPTGIGYEGFADHKGISVSEAKTMLSGIVAAAQEYGLDYRFDLTQSVNTLKAHRLAKWARTFEKEHELTELLLDGYFTKGANLGDNKTLLNYVKSVGLNAEEALKILESDTYVDEVKYEIFEAKQVGAEGVPFFVFNNRYGIAGAQPDELFVQTINQAMAEFAPKPFIINTTPNGGDSGICGPDENC